MPANRSPYYYTLFSSLVKRFFTFFSKKITDRSIPASKGKMSGEFAVYGEDIFRPNRYTAYRKQEQEAEEMDLIKTGKFLARLRREAGYTQECLGEKLGVSNKTVSRWETGAYLPPVEMLQAISGLYGVSINELLAGERLEGETAYRAAAEENLRQVMEQSAFSLEERKDYYKRKWRRDHALALILGGILPGAAFLAALFTDMAFLWLAAPLLAQAVYLIAYNRMMGYVERRAFYPREDGGEER